MSNTLATSCEELTHWKRLWCWEGLWAGGDVDNRGWDGWMASPTWWMWVWVNSWSWWWTGSPGVLQFMGSQSDTTEQQNWTEPNPGKRRSLDSTPYFEFSKEAVLITRGSVWSLTCIKFCLCLSHPSRAMLQVRQIPNCWLYWIQQFGTKYFKTSELQFLHW